MQIKVFRKTRALHIDGAFQCWTLEPPTPEKWPVDKKGVYCHPLGKYKLTLSKYHGEVWSWMRKLVPDIDKFGLPLISNLDGEKYEDWISYDDGIDRNGVDASRCVYIHVGNSVSDTLGCLLVGTGKGDNSLTGSTDAFKKIYDQIVKAEGGITIEFIEA